VAIPCHNATIYLHHIDSVIIRKSIITDNYPDIL